MIGELQPVRAGDGNIRALLEFAAQRMHEGVALAHQHENVAGPDRPCNALFDDRTGSIQSLSVAAIAAGQAARAATSP